MAKFRIDWGNPLTSGLIACYVPGITRGQNIAGTIGDLGPITAANNFDATVEGPSFKTATAADGLKATAPPAFLGGTNSYYWRGFIDNTGSLNDGTDLIGIAYNDPETSPFVFQVIAVLASVSGAIGLGWNSNGVLANTTTKDLTTTPGLYSYGGTFRPGGNAVFYKSGAVFSTDVYGATGPSSTASSSIILQGITFATPSSRPCKASCNIALIWNRELSAAEMAALDADPYAFLIPIEGELPALLAPTAPSLTTIAWQQSSGVAPKVAKAFPTQATGFSVPANPVSNTITGMGWYQPLGIAPPVAKAWQGKTFVPFNTAQVVSNNNITGIGWYQPFLIKPWPAAVAAPTQPTGFAVPPSVAAITGTLAVTEAPDVASFTVTYTAPPVFIPLLQDASVPGIRVVYYKSFVNVYPPLGNAGILAATEAQDIAAFNATFIITGILATTEGQDTASFTGSGVAPSGTLAVTEAPDTAAFVGNFVTIGTLAVTEAQDIGAFNGTVSLPASGTLAVTEAQDVASFTGTAIGLPVGILSTTELPDNVIILADYQPPPSVLSPSPYPSRYDYGWFEGKKIRKR